MARDPGVLFWQQDGVQYLLEIRPIPECEKPFTWQDVQTVVASLLRCNATAGSVTCERADLPNLPDARPTG